MDVGMMVHEIRGGMICRFDLAHDAAGSIAPGCSLFNGVAELKSEQCYAE